MSTWDKTMQKKKKKILSLFYKSTYKRLLAASYLINSEISTLWTLSQPGDFTVGFSLQTL